MEPEISQGEAPRESALPRNFFARLGGVYSSPRETFMEIGPAPQLWLPILAFVIIVVANAWYTAVKVDTSAVSAALLEKMVDAGAMTRAQMEQQLVAAAQQTPTPSAILLTSITSAVGGVIFLLFTAGYARLFSKMIHVENRYKSLVEVSAYALLAPMLIQLLLTILILQLKGHGRIPLDVSGTPIASNLGSWLVTIVGADALPRFLLLLASSVDVFTIWVIALLAIGYAAVSDKLKAATAALWLAIPYILIMLLSAAARALVGF